MVQFHGCVFHIAPVHPKPEYLQNFAFAGTDDIPVMGFRFN